MSISGLVLAGGRATRFGREKSLALLRGRPLIAWAIENIAVVTTTIGISAHPRSEAALYAGENNLPVISDLPSLCPGPLVGVASGLEWARQNGHEWLLTTPCDVPCIPHAAIRGLAARAASGEGAFLKTAHGAESLCAIWPVSGALAVKAALNGPRHPAAQKVLEQLAAVAVTCPSDSLMNVNSQNDLAMIEQSLTIQDYQMPVDEDLPT